LQVAIVHDAKSTSGLLKNLNQCT